MAAYCVLTYPTLEHWLTTAHLDSNEARASESAILRAAESTSTRLTIVVQTADRDALPNPWDPPLSSSSSSSSSGGRGGAGGGPLSSPSPTRFFLRLERALAHVYSIATDSFAQRDLVLAQVDVVLEQLRRQPVCIPSSATTVIRWQAKDDSVDTPVNENGEHKGKGKETNPANHAHSGADHHHHHHHDPHMKTIYPVVALGGTFDHLHSGHKILLTMAACITSRKLIVGVTDDALLKTKKFREWLEPLPLRIRNVENFIALIRPEIECACVPLQDVYGPTATDPEIEALVVSDETRAGGQAINTLRASRSLSILRIFCIALVAESSNTPSRVPSSTNLPAEARTTTKGDDDDNEAEEEDEEEEEDVEGKVVVSPATKMGSTGIRGWLSKRRHEEQRTGA